MPMNKRPHEYVKCNQMKEFRCTVSSTDLDIRLGSIPTSQLISDLSVLIVCNKTGGAMKGDKKKCNVLRSA